MSEAIKSWLRRRLGVIMDLSSDCFNRHTSDGTLLARILHSYDIIDCKQLETLQRTQDPALCRVNLKHLRVWLHLIGVECSDKLIQDISVGKGIASLQLFYKVYLSLEDKDKLYFVALRKERENNTAEGSRFKVTRVSDKPPAHRPQKHPLSKEIKKNIDSVQWYKKKLAGQESSIGRQKSEQEDKIEWNKEICQSILKNYRRERERFRDREAQRAPRLVKFVKPVIVNCESTDGEERPPKSNAFDELYCDPCENLESRPDARGDRSGFEKSYANWLKNRSKRYSATRELQLGMQKLLVSRILDDLRKNQQRRIDEYLAHRVLDQSRYEKRMMTKLFEIRDRRQAMIRNRKIVDKMIDEARDREAWMTYERSRLAACREKYDIDMELRRINELRNKFENAKTRVITEICASVVNDAIDISIFISELCDGFESPHVWSYCTALFIESQSIFQTILEIDKNDESTDVAISEIDFDRYHRFDRPWDGFLELDPEVEDSLITGDEIFSRIVYYLLEFENRDSVHSWRFAPPQVRLVAVVSGIEDSKSIETLESFSESSGVKVIRFEDAVRYCIESYNNEYVNDETEENNELVSSSADIGKWLREFINLGQPISDELGACAMAEYLKSFGDLRGWIFLDYPFNYKQLACLELVLTGNAMPPDPSEKTPIDIDDIEHVEPRIVFENEIFDTRRVSRLFSRPRDKYFHKSSFVTSYVRAARKPKNLKISENCRETLPANATQMDKYFSERNLAHVFYYTHLDSPTIERLAEFILGECTLTGSVDQSDSAFASDRSTASDSKQIVIRRYVTEFNDFECNSSEELESEETRPLITLQTDYRTISSLIDNWRILEKAYIENLKNAFRTKNNLTRDLIAKKNFISRRLAEFIDRPDERQELLDAFRRAFLRIESDARKERVVKRELTCRVKNFQTALWEICDTRKSEAEEERENIIRDSRVDLFAVRLIDFYLSLIQTETDRFVDSSRLIETFYLSALGKPIDDVKYERIALDGSVMKNPFSPEIIENSSSKKINPDAPLVDFANIENEVSTFLRDDKLRCLKIEENPFCKSFLEYVEFARTFGNSVANEAAETRRREDAVISRITGECARGNDVRSFREEVPIDRMRNLQIIEEWRVAQSYDSNRMNLRLSVLEKSFKSELKFTFDTMKKLFKRISNDIIGRYKSELKNVETMGFIFFDAIQNETAIPEIYLSEDLIVKYPRDDLEGTETLKNYSAPSELHLSRIRQLIKVFQRVSQSGDISRQALIYVLQDLTTLGSSECECSPLDDYWPGSSPEDVNTLVDEIYGTANEVDWRELVICELDLPSMNQLDVLRARERLLGRDQLVTLEQFCSTPLWSAEWEDASCEIERFESNEWSGDCQDFLLDDPEPEMAPVKKLLGEMYANETGKIDCTALLLAFCKDADPREGFGKALALTLGNPVCLDYEEGEKHVTIVRYRKLYHSKIIRAQKYEFVCDIIDEILLDVVSISKDSNEEIESNVNESSSTYLGVTNERDKLFNESDLQNFNSSCSFVGNYGKIGHWKRMNYWISQEVCLSVLTNSLPWHAKQTDLFNSGMTLAESIERVYKDLRDKQINEDVNITLAHQLVNHNFVRRLLNDTGRFKITRSGNVIGKISET